MIVIQNLSLFLELDKLIKWKWIIQVNYAFMLEHEVKWSKVAQSCLTLFATPWTVAYLAPPTMGFSRQEYWNGLPFPSPGDLPDPGIEPGPPALEADALTSEPPRKPQQMAIHWFFSNLDPTQTLYEIWNYFQFSFHDVGSSLFLLFFINKSNYIFDPYI